MKEWNIVEVERMMNEQNQSLKVECFFSNSALVTTVETGSIWNVMHTPLENLKHKTSQEVVDYLIKVWERTKGLL